MLLAVKTSSGFLLLLIAFTTPAISQSRKAETPRSQAVPAAKSQPKSKDLVETQNIRDFVERALGFHNLTAKVNTLVVLSNFMWERKGQEDSARELLTNLYAELTLA